MKRMVAMMTGLVGAVLLILLGIWLIKKRKGKKQLHFTGNEIQDSADYNFMEVSNCGKIDIQNSNRHWHNGIFSNISWVIYGLLFIINPVYPERYGNNEKKAKLGVRIAGIICVAVGLLTRFAV